MSSAECYWTCLRSGNISLREEEQACYLHEAHILAGDQVDGEENASELSTVKGDLPSEEGGPD